MSVPMDREGVVRGNLRDYGYKTFESGAECITMLVDVTEYYNDQTGQWEDWTEYGMTTKGNLFVYGKDHKILQRGVENAIQHLGWDTKVSSITNGTWKPTTAQFVIKQETWSSDKYGEVTEYKIAFVNGYDSDPVRGMEKPATDAAARMDAANQADMRAILGNIKRAAAKPASKPTAPPKPPETPDEPWSQDAINEAQANDDGVPF